VISGFPNLWQGFDHAFDVMEHSRFSVILQDWREIGRSGDSAQTFSHTLLLALEQSSSISALLQH
jgi:hypothetical protein